MKSLYNKLFKKEKKEKKNSSPKTLVQKTNNIKLNEKPDKGEKGKKIEKADENDLSFNGQSQFIFEEESVSDKLSNSHRSNF